MPKHEESGGISEVSLKEQNHPPAKRPTTQKVSGSSGGAHGNRPNEPSS